MPADRRLSALSVCATEVWERKESVSRRADIQYNQEALSAASRAGTITWWQSRVLFGNS